MAETESRTDAELLSSVAAADCGALQVLYRRHAGWLSIRLHRRCNDDEVVADVLQDTFVAVWRSARRWRGDGEVAAWLWGIAVRRLVSRLRGRRDLVPQPVEPCSEPSVEERVLLGVEYGDLGRALERLSPELRAVIQATVLDDLSARETGHLLGIPSGTVRTRLFRAKAQLRRELAGGPEMAGERP